MVLDARSVLVCTVLAFPLAWFWRHVAVPLILKAPRTSTEALELLNSVSGIRPESMHEAMDVLRGYFLYVVRNVNPWLLSLLLIVLLVALECCCTAPPRKPPPFDSQRLRRKRFEGAAGGAGDGGRGGSSGRKGQKGHAKTSKCDVAGDDGCEQDTGDASLDAELAGIHREIDDILSELDKIDGTITEAAGDSIDAIDGSASSSVADHNRHSSDGVSTVGSSGTGLRARRNLGQKHKQEHKDIAATTVKQATI